MKTFLPLALAATLLAAALHAEPALTIYNQNFAVVRDTVHLDLKAGVTSVNYAEATAHLEPESVILRDPTGRTAFSILEQNYRNDPVSQGLMLSAFEGKTIDFLIQEAGKPDRFVQGKIIRSGYVPPDPDASAQGETLQPVFEVAGRMQYTSPRGETPQPVIEVDGRMQFQLPGLPLFPSLGDDTILKPTLTWQIESQAAAPVDAEIGYVTGGMSWSADYNLSAPEHGDDVDIAGWLTMGNHTGKTFENARIKLMAGDVNKIQPRQSKMREMLAYGMVMGGASSPPVTEKTFDEYHLYIVSRPVTLRDQQTKQVEFVHASGVHAPKIYVYDGARFNGGPWNPSMASGEVDVDNAWGLGTSKKVAVLREFKNSAENHLGIPLPAGRIRFYRQGDDRQLEFIGENTIDHTPKDETLHIYTGDSFDLVGDRKRTDFHIDQAEHTADESFEISLRNHKTEPAQIRVVEHLYRWTNWQITHSSDPFSKANAQEIQFEIPVDANGQKTVTYSVHYSW